MENHELEPPVTHPFWCAEDVYLGEGASRRLCHRALLADTDEVTIDLVMPHDSPSDCQAGPQWRLMIHEVEVPLPVTFNTFTVLDLMWAVSRASNRLEDFLQAVPDGDSTFESLTYVAEDRDQDEGTTTTSEGPSNAMPDVVPEHPAWCPIEHSDDPRGYDKALAVISHDVAEIGDAVFDLVMVGGRSGEGDPRHVYVDLNDLTSVGYCGYSVEEIGWVVELLARVAAAMRAVDQGDIREAVAPVGVSLSLPFTVMDTDPE